MALPVLTAPKYTLTVPSTQQTIEYRPFLVKEEKILLLAQESNNQKEIMSAIRDVVETCTYGTVKANLLTSFDLEYIFLKLRAKSVGEIVDIKCKCTSCETYGAGEVNLDTVEVTWPSTKVDNKIMLTDKVGIVLRHISVDDLNKIGLDENVNVETVTNMIIASIESIFDDSAVYPAAQSSQAELKEFVNSLSRSQVSKIEAYIENAPKLQHEIRFVCAQCKTDNSQVLTGTQSFFA